MYEWSRLPVSLLFVAIKIFQIAKLLGLFPFSSKVSGRGDGGAGGALAPPLFAKVKFAHLYFTVLR